MATQRQPVGSSSGGNAQREEETEAASLIAAIRLKQDTVRRVTEALHRNRPDTMVQDNVVPKNEGEMTSDWLEHLLLLSVNGDQALHEQTVIVQYLKNDQKLVIPAALGMSLRADIAGRCVTGELWRDRYLKCSRLTYAEIHDLVTPTANKTRIRRIIDALPLPPVANRVRRTDWYEHDWMVQADGTLDEKYFGDTTMAVFSQMLQFNCDIRDFGILNEPNMSVGDADWRFPTRVIPAADRLSSRMTAYTLKNIAALNLRAVAGCELAAWVRAFGLSMGLMPAVGSRAVREYVFEASFPASNDVNSVLVYSTKYERPMISLCANIIAMFGLFHLNKDHTFRTNDQNMMRIGKSYTNTLRTDADAETITYIQNNMEAICRTAAHPFGLASPYWLARVMRAHNMLMAPLAIRVDTSPPPVQRLLICLAAVSEWEGLPIGKQVSDLYKEEIAVIRSQVAAIKLAPPAFSSLARLYGMDRQYLIDDSVWHCVTAMLPAVYGYIMAQHVEDKEGKDGLGWALSLDNIKRDMRGIATAWQNAWEKYTRDMEDTGIMTFVMKAGEIPKAEIDAHITLAPQPGTEDQVVMGQVPVVQQPVMQPPVVNPEVGNQIPPNQGVGPGDQQPPAGA